MGCALQARDISYLYKEEQTHHVLLVQVVEGTKQVLGAGSPSASIQFLFLLTMQCRALNFCFSMKIEEQSPSSVLRH